MTNWDGPEAKYVVNILSSVVIGDYEYFNELHQIEGRRMFIDDILIHELVHVFVAERGIYETSHGYHGPIFAQECNRIAASIGIEKTVSWRRKRNRSRGTILCNYWPDRVRPDGYFLDLIRPRQIAANAYTE